MIDAGESPDGQGVSAGEDAADERDAAASGRDDAAEDRDSVHGGEQLDAENDRFAARDRTAAARDREDAAARGSRAAARDEAAEARGTAAYGGPEQDIRNRARSNSDRAAAALDRRDEASAALAALARDDAATVRDVASSHRHAADAAGGRTNAAGDRAAAALDRAGSAADRQVASDQLRNAADTLAAIVNSSPDAVIGNTVDGIITTWNDGATSVYGHSADEMVGQNFEVMVPPESLDAERARNIRVVAGAAESGYRCVRLRSDGGRIEVVMSMSPIFDATGAINGTASISRPISAAERDEARFASLLEAAPDAIVCVDARGTIVTINAQVTQMFGYERDELVGSELEVLLPEESRGRHAGLRSQFLLDPKARSMGVGLPLWGRRRDGSVFPIEVSLAPDRARAETIVIAAVRDMTAQRDLERDVLESESRLRQLAENTGTVFILSQLDPPALLYVSPGSRAVLGVEPDELISDPSLLGRLIHPDDLARAAVERQESIGAGVTDESEHRILLGDGTVRWIRSVSTPVTNPHGPPERVVITIEDISARMTATLARLEAETQLRQLAENVDIVFILRKIDPPDILYVSPSARSVLGHEPSEWMDGASVLTIHPLDRDRIERENTVAVAGLATQAEFRLLKPDGTTQWVRTVSTPVANPYGPPERSVITIEDITERVEVAEALQQAEAAAVVANQAKNLFLSRMSHELRTPLNAVLGFGQLLEMRLDTGDDAEAVRQILKGGRHLLELINDVLDIARIEAGQTPMSVEAVLVSSVVEETVQLMATVADAAGVTLTPSRHPTDLMVLADRQRLRQVLLNLLSNAIKYNHRGGRVWVGVAVGQNQISVTVDDDGPGIPPELQARLFTPFDRLGAEASGVEGSGIGLALTRSLAELMGGTLTVDSAPGRGSAFTVTLPRAEVTSSDHSVPSDPEELESPETAWPARRCTLLYIEDNEPNVRVVEHMLKLRPGWRLLHAGLGGLGVELATAHLPDLILLDLHLPDGSGADVLQQLKQHPTTRDLPVVMLTADATTGQSRRLLELGAANYLTKPLDLADLLVLLDHTSTSPS